MLSFVIGVLAGASAMFIFKKKVLAFLVRLSMAIQQLLLKIIDILNKV